MKKTKVTVLFALAVLGLTLVQPTSASEIKSLVIIDSYFDSRVIGGNVSCITPEDKACVDAQNIKSPQGLNTAFNHGNAMVEVAKKQNPQMKITALYSANSNNFTPCVLAPN